MGQPPTGPDPSGGAGAPPKAKQGSVQSAEEVMAYLRRQHPALASEIEAMLEEVIVRFKPEPEEELLSAVHALLMKCFQLPALPAADARTAPPDTLRTTLDRVCRKFFAPQTQHKSRKHSRFVAEYKEQFERDFRPHFRAVAPAEGAGAADGSAAPSSGTSSGDEAESKTTATDGAADAPSGDAADTGAGGAGSGEAGGDGADGDDDGDAKMKGHKKAARVPNPNFPATLTQVVARLKHWRRRLQARVHNLSEALKMEECSQYLVELHSAYIEIPGQYTLDSEPQPATHVKLDRFESDVRTVCG